MELKNPVKWRKYFPLTYSSKDLYIRLKNSQNYSTKKANKTPQKVGNDVMRQFFRNIEMSDEYMGRWTPPVIRVMPKGDTAALLSEPNRCADVKYGSKTHGWLDRGESGHSDVTGRNIKWYSHPGKQFCSYSSH